MADWLRQLNAVDSDVARTLAQAVTAYNSGDLGATYGALGRWSDALKQARNIRYTPPAGPSNRPWAPGCWGRVAALYDSAYKWMGTVAPELSMELLAGPSRSLGPVTDPVEAFIDIVLNYHPASAGDLTGDAIEAACEPAPGLAPQLPCAGWRGQ